MSNFLYHTVTFIYDNVNKNLNTTLPADVNNVSYDAFCPNPPSDGFRNKTTSGFLYPSTDWLGDSQSNGTTSESVFATIWSQTLTVPFFLLLVLGPLVNFKSPTFFTKFNALGTVSVVYIMVFVAYKASRWGLHLDFDPADDNMYIPEFQWTFPTLTGTLSLAFFIHNCVLSIVKNQRHPQHNARDLSIAYVCVAFTYMFIAVVFYSCFPLPKSCIEDNLLNNFRSGDAMAFASRLFLFFQMVTVFPLILYIFRIQLLGALCGSIYPSWKHVLGLNAGVLSICLLFAIFLPQIGVIIRFSGALCGFAYVFTLPCIIHMLSLKSKGQLTWPIIIFHSAIIVFGGANFIAQFLILGKT
ncbi:Sodium-coupled neutral amino acid transporter 9 [Lamellibrachia satsuma]|nr:Sodium-coupled neutral amino acid transporter 9 [Lamellibrachia satsuma]